MAIRPYLPAIWIIMDESQNKLQRLSSRQDCYQRFGMCEY